LDFGAASEVVVEDEETAPLERAVSLREAIMLDRAGGAAGGAGAWARELPTAEQLATANSVLPTAERRAEIVAPAAEYERLAQLLLIP